MARTKLTCGRLRAAKGETKQTQNQSTTSANTYGYVNTPETADTTALRNFKFEHDPRIPYAFARGRANVHNNYANPLGGSLGGNAQLRDAALNANDQDSAQQEGQALSEENYGLQGLKYGQLADIASRTAPRFVQTGGSSTGSGTTTVQQPFDWSGLISGGASMGAAMLM